MAPLTSSAPNSARGRSASPRPPQSLTPRGGRAPAKKVDGQTKALGGKVLVESARSRHSTSSAPASSRPISTERRGSKETVTTERRGSKDTVINTERRGSKDVAAKDAFAPVGAPAVAAPAIARAAERRNSKDAQASAPSATSVLAMAGMPVQEVSAELSTTVMSIELSNAIHAAADAAASEAKLLGLSDEKAQRFFNIVVRCVARTMTMHMSMHKCVVRHVD